MIRRLLASAVALSFAAAPVAAQPADARAATERDLRCVLVSAIVASRVSDPGQRTALIGGFSYFMGRIKGREPGIDLKARVLATAQGMETAQMQSEFVRCEAEMKAFGVESTAVGETLKALGRGTPTP